MQNKFFSRATVSVGKAKVHLGFTSIEAGNLGLHVGEEPQQVIKNRKALEDELGLQRSFLYLNQVHGTEVCEAEALTEDEPEIYGLAQPGGACANSAPTADAAVSQTGRPLAVMVADCIPIILVGKTTSDAPVIAVAHAGRRGLLGGVIQRTVATMAGFGAEQIQAWLGPSICGKCYEVQQAMLEESSRIYSELASTTSWGTPALDLPAGAQAVLSSLRQVSEIHGELSACTLEEDQLFSYRGGEPLGRIAGLVWVEE